MFCVKLYNVALRCPEHILLCLSSAAAESSVCQGDDRPLCPQRRPHASPQQMGREGFHQTMSPKKSQGMNPPGRPVLPGIQLVPSSVSSTYLAVKVELMFFR